MAEHEETNSLIRYWILHYIISTEDNSHVNTGIYVRFSFAVNLGIGSWIPGTVNSDLTFFIEIIVFFSLLPKLFFS
jgi:hypothetical protein